jgi:hypothetical protein
MIRVLAIVFASSQGIHNVRRRRRRYTRAHASYSSPCCIRRHTLLVMKRTGFVSVLILGITLSASTVWCAPVADVDAHTAVSDAWVIATREACVGFGHCNPYCAEVHVGKTDSAGQVPFFTTLGRSKEVRFYVYKRGYWFLGPNQGYYRLSSKRPYVPDNFLDDASERIRQLVSLTGATACPAAIPLQRAPLSSLYKEMCTAAMTHKRCSWASVDGPMLLQYHDLEWGVPVHNDRKHFEVLVLTGCTRCSRASRTSRTFDGICRPPNPR